MIPGRVLILCCFSCHVEGVLDSKSSFGNKVSVRVHSPDLKSAFDYQNNQYYNITNDNYIGYSNTMVSLITVAKAQRNLAENARAHRLQMELTQEGLAVRSGVPLPTLRKFEQKSTISLESYLKLQMVLGGLENLLKATQVKAPLFSSIDDVLEADSASTRKRGKRK